MSGARAHNYIVLKNIDYEEYLYGGDSCKHLDKSPHINLLVPYFVHATTFIGNETTPDSIMDVATTFAS